MKTLPAPELPVFDYIRPTSASEVFDLLRRHSVDSCLFMGGTDVFVRMRDGFMSPAVVVDLKHLPGMMDISHDAGSGLRVGAAVPMNMLAKHPVVQSQYPLIAEAIQTVAAFPLRTRATMGGNLCNASPAADTAPCALVLDARMVAIGPAGERAIPANAFFVGPGKNSLQADEYLQRIEFPVPPAGYKGRYIKLGRNANGDLAIVGVAAVGFASKKAQSGYEFRIALASVAPTPIRVPVAEELLSQSKLDQSALEKAAAIAQDTSAPIDDVRASARYRKAMVRNMTLRALQDVWNMLKGDE